MSTSSALSRFFLHPAWSIVGIVLAIGMFLWQETKNPYEFRIELLDEFNLIEVKDQVSDLKVFYKNENILDNNKEIRVFRIKFSNPGEAILQNFYDQFEDFGLQIHNSKVLSAEITKTSSKNLREKFLIPINPNISGDTVLFNKVIFDKNSEVTLKVITLYSKGQKVSFNVLGKIANVGELTVTKTERDDDSILTKPKITALYFIAGYLGLVVFLLILIFIIDFFEKRKRLSRIVDYSKGKTFTSDEYKIIELYEKGFNSSQTYIIKELLKGYQVISLNSASTPKSFTDVFGPPFSSKYRELSLPKEIFELENGEIRFKRDIEGFLRDFFSKMYP